MTLRRQFSLMASALILLLLCGNLFVTLSNAGKYFQQQLNARAYDAATSLALSMSNAVQDGDRVKLERMIDVLFDRGFFAEITLTLTDGEVIRRHSHQATQDRPAPAWFMSLVDLSVVDAQTDVTQGWQRLGSLVIRSHTDFAYRDLWGIVRGELIWFMWMALFSLVGLQILLRLMFRPLKRVEQQALDISERNLYELPVLPRTRELKRVVSAMNQMVRKLKMIFAEQSALTEKLLQESCEDDVTGLLNRRGFDERLTHIMASPEGFSGVLILIQIKDFAAFNMEHGRAEGDALLSQIGDALKQWQEQHSDALVCRRTGSDFALYVPATDHTHAEEVVSRCFGYLSSTALTSRNQHYFHSGAVYLAGAGADDESLVSAFSRADAALREAQRQQASRFCLYGAGERTDEWTATEWKDCLEHVLAQEELILHFQPVVDARGEKLLHYEVLSRIEHNGQLIPAARFWPVAERYQLTPEFDLLVVRTLLKMLTDQPDHNIRFCVNLSAASVLDESFHSRLEALFARYPDPVPELCLEIAEFSVSHVESSLARLAHRLQHHKVSLGIDQVGTGALAFAYLQRLPLTYLRIAGSFNRGLHKALDHRFFIQSMVQIAHNLDLQVFGEGVENEEDIHALKQTGVDGMSGYWFSKPLHSLDEAINWKSDSDHESE